MGNRIKEIFEEETRKREQSLENIKKAFSTYSNSGQETPKMTTSARQYKSKDDFIKSTSSKAFFNNKQDENKRKIEEIFNNRRAENNTKEQENKQNTPPKLTEDIIKEYSNSFNQNMGRLNQNTTGTNLNKNYNRTQNQQKKPIVPMKINTEELQDPQKVTWNDIKARKEAEQINEDIKKGDYSSSIGHILNSFLGGVKQSASGIASTVLLPIGGVTKKLSESNIVNDKWKEKLSDFSDDVFDASEYIGEQGNYSSNVNSQVDNNIVKTGGQVSNVLGNLATSVLANVIAPGSGATVNAVTVGGNSAQETLNEDRDNVAQSMLTGATKGYISKKVEGITGGNFLSKGNLDDLATRTIEKNIKSNLGKEIATRGYQVLGEMGEEQIEDNLGYVVDKLINDKDLPDFQEWWNQTGETNKVTFLSTLALQMVGLGGSTRNNSENIYSDVDTKTANKWINEAKKIIEKENINTSIQTTQNSPIIPINKNQNTNQNVQEVQSTPIVPFNQERQNTQENSSNNRPINAYTEGNNFLNNNIVPLRNNIENTESGTDIKRINQNHSTSAEAFSTSLVNSNNNIAPLKDNINTTNQIVENPTQMKYNTNIDNETNLQQSNNEGVGGNYGRSIKANNEEIQSNDRRRVQGLLELYEKGQRYGDSNSEKLYGIKETEEVTERKVKHDLISYANQNKKRQLTSIEQKLKQTINDLGGEVVFYEYGPENYFQGLADKNTFYIDSSGDNNVENVFYHELVHFLRQNKNESYIKEIEPIVDKIASDFDYQEAIFNYAKSSSDYFDIRDLDGRKQHILAEEVVADQVASIYGNLKADYGLDEEMKQSIKQSMDKILTKNKENISENVETPIVPINKKTMNPTEISNIKPEEASTTPKLPNGFENKKVRKHYKSIMQSANTTSEAKAIAKELMGTDTYVPDSNERQLKLADDRIERNGADNEAVTLATKVRNGDRITAEDIATGERLIEYYSKIGDREKLQDSIQNVALAGTQAGQTVQAMSLINRQTPQGQAIYLSKVVDRMNNEIDKRTKGKGKKFELTPEMLEKITTSSKENLESNIDEVARELANQVPKTTIEKIDSWRYFSMLANPRTHFRNIIGNFSMASVQTIKNKVAGGLESIAQKTGMIDKRTKTLRPASKETKDFAKMDVNNVMARLNNESKFDTKNLIQQYQRTFKSDLLERTLGKLYDLNSKALEAEDVFSLKQGYSKALADYMTANKLTKADLTAGTKEADIQLERARKYAIEQAQEATFHQQSSMASLLNTIEKKNVFTKVATGAVIPFKKTPINVAKTGVAYSPLGLVKSFTLDIANLNNGKITVNQYIDNLAKGLTGTGITAVGYALAQAGILSASGDDDDQKNQYYQEDRGNQPFSIRIGNKTYSLDWLSPTAIPLFIGAELNYNVNHAGEEQTAEDVLDRVSNTIDAMSSAMNPMIEMSMLSGIANTIKSFSQGDTQVFQNLAINAGKSYINQFFPTLGGQIAKIVDDTERSTTSTKKNAFARAVDSTGKQVLNKIPFASKLLPAKTDVWGNTLKRDSNPLYRVLQQMAFPWTEKNLKSTNVDNAISDLYEETGEKSVLPNTSINKDFTFNGKDYRLTSEEYAEYKKQYGKNSYDLLSRLVDSKEYQNMNNEQKTEAISKIYEYANEKNKVNYANKKKINMETSSLYNTVNSIEQEGGKGSDYFKYLGQIKGVEKENEKIKILEKSNIPLKSKSSIYVNTIGKSDELYQILKKDKININEYLKYKEQEFESDRKDDGTTSGKAISGSKKKKVYNYVNNMNITYKQRLLLLGTQYKLTTNERKELAYYVNSLPNTTKKDKLKIYEKLKGFTVYKNGTVSW